MRQGTIGGSRDVPGIDNKAGGHAVRAGRDAISAVGLSQQLTADVDAWAEARQISRSEAICQLLEIGLNASPSRSEQHSGTVREHETDIEDLAAAQIGQLLDPELPPDERERRTRRLIEGPPEFSDQRIDLPRHEK
jgi:hypothetical protein